MTKIKPFTCPNCGAGVNVQRLICEYCGTTFKEERDPFDLGPVKLVISQPAVKTAVAMATVDRYMRLALGEDVEKYVREELVTKIAKLIADEVDLKVREDLLTNSFIYRADIRVVDPAFRF